MDSAPDSVDHEPYRKALYADEPIEGLADHVAACPSCRALKERLERMDQRIWDRPVPAPRPTLIDEILAQTTGAARLDTIVVDRVRESDVNVVRELLLSVMDYMNLREYATAIVRRDGVDTVPRWGHFEWPDERFIVQVRSRSEASRVVLDQDMLAALAREGRLPDDVWRRLEAQPWAARLKKLMGMDWSRAFPAVGQVASLINGHRQEAWIQRWHLRRIATGRRARPLPCPTALDPDGFQIIRSIELRLALPVYAPRRWSSALGWLRTVLRALQQSMPVNHRPRPRWLIPALPVVVILLVVGLGPAPFPRANLPQLVMRELQTSTGHPAPKDRSGWGLVATPTHEGQDAVSEPLSGQNAALTIAETPAVQRPIATRPKATPATPGMPPAADPVGSEAGRPPVPARGELGP
jgi:hypothetical protein